MVSVVIPTFNSEAHLARCLTALVPAAVDGLVREVLIVDGGSTDATAKIADSSGATFIRGERSFGQQLATGAHAAKGRWLLFLRAGTVLCGSWEEEAAKFMRTVDFGERPESAAVFRFSLDDGGFRAACRQITMRLRGSLLALPCGEQGLLISRQLYDALGGFRPLTLMEDMDIARRLGRQRIKRLRADAVTNVHCYQQEHASRKPLRNLACLGLFCLRVPTRYISRLI
jgi:glycosyltransferase involved in cell wall biosynthesis